MHGRLNFAGGAAAQKKGTRFCRVLCQGTPGMRVSSRGCRGAGMFESKQMGFHMAHSLAWVSQICQGLRVSSKSLKFLTQNKKGLLIAGVQKSI